MKSHGVVGTQAQPAFNSKEKSAFPEGHKYASKNLSHKVTLTASIPRKGQKKKKEEEKKMRKCNLPFLEENNAISISPCSPWGTYPVRQTVTHCHSSETGNLLMLGFLFPLTSVGIESSQPHLEHCRTNAYKL